MKFCTFYTQLRVSCFCFQRLSTTDSDPEQSNASKVARVTSSSQRDKYHQSEFKQYSPSQSTTPRDSHQASQQKNVPPIDATGEETQLPRPHSPNVEEIAEHNRISANAKKQDTGKFKLYR